MAIGDLLALDDLAKTQTNKSPGELPVKAVALVGATLNTALAGHTPTYEVENVGTLLWNLTDRGAKAVQLQRIEDR